MLLPSASTLRSYIGKSTGDVGFTPVAEKRLQLLAINLCEQEKEVSIEVDEMSLEPKMKKIRQWDRIVGQVNSGGILVIQDGKPILANRLLAFHMTGLSTAFKCPVAYFFVRQLTAKDLFKLTEFVLEGVEKHGFHVARIVGDNASTNVKMFRMWSPDGKLVPFIKHPLDEDRLLFFSFDYTHILKNIRNLQADRVFDICGQTVSFKLLRRVQEIQKHFPFFRPYRNFTEKHTNPNTLDRMKVRFAYDVFSDELIATFELFKKYGAEGFTNEANVNATITFMKDVNMIFFKFTMYTTRLNISVVDWLLKSILQEEMIRV